MKKLIWIFILLFAIKTSFACSCANINIVNVFSYSDFIGIVEFESLSKIENSNDFYKSKFKLKELIKGDTNSEIIIVSQEGSSCQFIPRLGKEYLVFAEKNSKGKILISFCSAINTPSESVLKNFRELSEFKEAKNIGKNLIQYSENEINSALFEKSEKRKFIYKVTLNSKLEIIEIKPLNKKAKRNFNKKIKKELLEKVKYRKLEERISLKKDRLNSYILLNWKKNMKIKELLN